MAENLNDNTRLKNFKNQIESDLSDIENDFKDYDPNITNKDYAFLYWVLLKIFNIDEESVMDCITEYNDKSIDCFVHFEETKELFIIQCKHYNDDTKVIRNMFADFLQSPLSFLEQGKYTRSKKLQKIYDKAIKDPDYRILMQFYSSNINQSSDIETLNAHFNEEKRKNNLNIRSSYFNLKDIYEKYYGESYKKTTNLSFDLQTINKGTFASLKEEYGINYEYQGYYIITPVIQIYNLLKKASEVGYQLFEENIREYLGIGGTVNSAIANTLRSKERINFLYYNNGLTMIVKKTPKQSQGAEARVLTLYNPQIVNGCQTVNTIYRVLDDYTDSDREKDFKDVFVMTKLLIIPTEEEKDKTFYQDVVKYTNKQNPIPDKIFAASNQTVFSRIQTELKRYGFWLKVKQSDKLKFDELSPKEKGDLLNRANEIAASLNIKLSHKDLQIDLEKMLQICLAFITDGYNAFTKKSSVLKQNTEIFKKYSINIQDYLSFENMIRLYLVFKKAEQDQKASDDKRTPIPYYVLGFLSYFIKDKNDLENFNRMLNTIFDSGTENVQSIYRFLVKLSSLYRKEMNLDYNVLIKKQIDAQVLEKEIEITSNFMEKEYSFLINCWKKLD